MKYTFESAFAELIEEYISFKTAMGYAESSYDRILHQFDSFCAQKYPQAKALTKEIIEEWSQLRTEKENRNGLIRRMICLNGFSKHLILTGHDAYTIPEGTIGKYDVFLPYIYTDQEIVDFFYVADNFPMKRYKSNQDIVLPVLFRMMFCCGLRPQEVPGIRCDHVDLSRRTLFIEDTKQHKDRHLVMSEELTGLCTQYESKICSRIQRREYFFQLPTGNKISISWMQQQFRRCWEVAGYHFSQGHHPRNYDWRHNFATRVLLKWFDDGENVYANLPYLCTYMGHSKLKHTLYYIHLLPERLTSSGKMDWECLSEVPAYED